MRGARAADEAAVAVDGHEGRVHVDEGDLEERGGRRVGREHPEVHQKVEGKHGEGERETRQQQGAPGDAPSHAADEDDRAGQMQNKQACQRDPKDLADERGERKGNDSQRKAQLKLAPLLKERREHVARRHQGHAAYHGQVERLPRGGGLELGGHGKALGNVAQGHQDYEGDHVQGMVLSGLRMRRLAQYRSTAKNMPMQSTKIKRPMSW